MLSKEPSGLQAVVVSGEHVGGKEVGVAVVVDIGHVGAHGGEADMADAVFQFVFEGAVLWLI